MGPELCVRGCDIACAILTLDLRRLHANGACKYNREIYYTKHDFEVCMGKI